MYPVPVGENIDTVIAVPPVVYSNPEAPPNAVELLYWICLLLPPGVPPPPVGAATHAITPSIPEDKYEEPVPVGVLGGKIYVVFAEPANRNPE